MVKSEAPFWPKVTDLLPSILTVYLESFCLLGSSLTARISDFSLTYLGFFSTSTELLLQVLHTNMDGFFGASSVLTSSDIAIL